VDGGIGTTDIKQNRDHQHRVPGLNTLLNPYGYGAITCVAKTRTRTMESHWDRNKKPALQLERERAVMNVDGNGNVFIFYLFI